MQHNDRNLAIAQILRGLIWLAIAAVCVAADITNNLNYFGAINQQFAHITALAAVMIVILPWRRWGALKAVCLLLAVWAGWANYAGSISQSVSTNVEAARQKSGKARDADAARQRLAQIAETGDTRVLRQLSEVAKRAADDAGAAARAALGEDSACQKVTRCRKAADDYSRALERQSGAEARDAYRAQIAEADAAGGKIVAPRQDVMAVKIAAFFSSDYEGTAQTLALLISAIIVVVCQGGALLGHSAVEEIGGGFVKLVGSRQAVDKPRQSKMTKADALRVLLDRIDRFGGQMVASQAQIAKLFPDVPRTTIVGKRGWLAQWVAAGELKAHANVWRKAA